jgi:hypothetical protein
MDCTAAIDYGERQTENVRLALEWFASRCDADYTLLLEDDLDFNPHFRWNVEHWSPLLDHALDFGSFYNPNVRMNMEGDDYSIADPNACYGSQAYLLSRAAARILLEHWGTVHGMQDIRITRILSGKQRPLFYHKPSLVKHIGFTSVWGGHFHDAIDFSAEWKASWLGKQDVARGY